MVVLPLYWLIFQFLLCVFICDSTPLPLGLSISSSKCLKYINKMCNIFSGFTCKMKLVNVAFCLCIFMKTSFPTHLYFLAFINFYKLHHCDLPPTHNCCHCFHHCCHFHCRYDHLYLHASYQLLLQDVLINIHVPLHLRHYCYCWFLYLMNHLSLHPCEWLVFIKFN